MSWTTPPQRRTSGPPAQRPVVKPPQDDAGGLLKKYINKPVVIVLLFGETWRGTMRTISKFELEIELANGAKLVLFKGAVASITEEKAEP